MLSRLNRFLHFRFPSKIPSFSNQPFSSSRSARNFPSSSLPSPHPQSLASNTRSLLAHLRPFSSNQGASGGNGEDSWKFTAESEDQNSIFELEEGFESREVETKRSGVVIHGGSRWDEGSSADVERDIFEGIDQEITPKEGGGDVVWETKEGYKPWSMGEDDDEKSDFFGVGEDAGAMEGFEGEGVDELEKERNEEQEKLQQREQELLATLNGNRVVH